MAVSAKSFFKQIGSGTTYTDVANIIDFTDTDNLGGKANYLEIHVMENANLKVRRYRTNTSYADMELDGPVIFICNRNDFPINKIAFDNTASGGSPSVDVNVVALR